MLGVTAAGGETLSKLVNTVRVLPHVHWTDVAISIAADLGVQDVAWQPVLRYAVAHHAAGRGVRILDGDRVTHTGEVVGGGQAGRPRAYHQHPLTRRRRVDGNLPALAERLVAEEPLHRVDAYGRVQLSPVAGGSRTAVSRPGP